MLAMSGEINLLCRSAVHVHVAGGGADGESIQLPLLPASGEGEPGQVPPG
jgi:hypothetical protein